MWVPRGEHLFIVKASHNARTRTAISQPHGGWLIPLWLATCSALARQGSGGHTCPPSALPPLTNLLSSLISDHEPGTSAEHLLRDQESNGRTENPWSNDRSHPHSCLEPQEVSVPHGLATSKLRPARAAAITAATTSRVTEAARAAEPFGLCLAAAGPSELVCMDSFSIGKLEGVGKVHQVTAIDVVTRWVLSMIVLGPVTATPHRLVPPSPPTPPGATA
jgi:hypothetical protein